MTQCGTYPNPRDRSSLEAWNQIGRTSVEQTSAWELLVLVFVCRQGATKWSRGGFSERRAGQGRICIAEVRIAMIQGFTSPGCAIDMLIQFRESCFQISLVKIPSYNEWGKVIFSDESPFRLFGASGKKACPEKTR